MIDHLNLPWILASASPRRVELLARLGRPFEVVPANVDEDALTVASPTATAIDLATAKARLVANAHPNALVIGADTVVALGDTQLAKPSDREDAVRMLRMLSGQTHRVITGACLIWPGHSVAFHEESVVIFRNLTDSEIERYTATGEPMDKAGAYAIQGGAANFVRSLNGSLENVVGLPIEALTLVLRRFELYQG